MEIVLALVYILALSVLVSVAVFAVLIVQLVYVSRDAPFVTLPKDAIPEVIRALRLHDDAVLFDLGCGDGRVLKACYITHPNARYFGIDKGILPIMLARVKGPRAIKFIRGDILKESIGSATHIFVYLFPEFMDILLPKFESELSSGTRLVSCDFAFSAKEPDDVVDIASPKRKRATRLYIYTF